MQQPSPVKKREGFMRRLTKRFHLHDRDDVATAGPPAAGATAQPAAAASMSRRHSLTDALPSTATSATLLPAAVSLKQPVGLLKPPQPAAPQPINTSSSAQSFRRHSSAPIVSDNSAALQPTTTTATMSTSSTESSSSSNQLVKNDSARLDAVSENGDEVFDECEYNEDEDVEEYDDDVENEENQNLNAKSQQELNRSDSASKKNKNPINITIGLATAEGLMGHDNEDRMIVEQNEDFHLLAVLDGHGGNMVADFVKDHLFPAIARCYDHGFNLQELSDTIDSLDQQAQAKAQQILDYSGACLICVLLYTDEATGVPQTLTLNVGDCRAIMHEARGKGKKDNKGVGPNGKLYALSQDHCESNSKEKARVLASGAVVEYGRIGGVLEPFRSIGDIDMKEREMDGWVIATPEIKKTRLLVGRSTLVLATDGVWGSLVNQKVMALARKFANDPQAAADAIVAAAREAGSLDDIAVVIAKV